MSTKKKFFSGNSIEQAVLQAARHFEIDASEVAYRQIERRHGFLKTRRRAVIEVDVENPRLEAAPGAQPAPQPEDAGEVGSKAQVREPDRHEGSKAAAAEVLVPAPAEETDTVPDERMTSLPERPTRELKEADADVAEAAEEAVRRLCALGDVTVETEIFEGPEGLEIEVSGKDEDVFLEDRGRLLLAMQHLIPRLIRGLTGETVACRVDCDNFQEIRAEQLRVLAQKVAAEVRERGRSRTLEPMSPDERRIIHMTLADDRAVETESQGSGLFKRVMVMPANRRSRSFEPYRR